jgi:hypothetical protein
VTEVTLPNGDHVVFKDPSTLTERARRAIKKAALGLDSATIANIQAAVEKGEEVSASMFTAADLAIADDLNDASAIALIESWTRGDTAVVPSVDELLDLNGPSYDALIEAANPLIMQLAVNANEPTPDQASPTQPVSA